VIRYESDNVIVSNQCSILHVSVKVCTHVQWGGVKLLMAYINCFLFPRSIRAPASPAAAGSACP